MIKRKYILYLFISLFIFNSCLINVYAFSGTVSNLDSGNSEQTSKPGQGKDDKGPDVTKSGTDTDTVNDKISYEYEYSYNLYSNDSISVNAYDLDGNSLIPDSLDFGSYRATAGMALRININESKSAGYKDLTVKVTKITEGISYPCGCSYNCNYISTQSSNDTEAIARCAGFNKKNQGRCETQDGCKLQQDKINCGTCIEKVNPVSLSAGDPVYDKYKKKAVDEAKSRIMGMLSSGNYSINATDSNDPNKFYSIDMDSSSEDSGLNCNGNNTSCSITRTIKYSAKNVCMNLKNGNVNYGRECNESEVKIADYEDKKGDKYFHYYVPLAITSDSKNVMISISNDNVYSVKVCSQTIDKDKSYLDFIIPNSGKDGNSNAFNGNPENDKMLVEQGGGCKAAININIPVAQKFFKEAKTDDGKLTLSDHNFYYRKININNPFPRGVESYSLWKDWYNKNYQGGSYKNNAQGKPNIKSSFKSITYVSTPSQVNNSYGISTGYMDWKKMTLKGLNEYINNGLVATRNITTDKIYSLGMGPGVCIDEGVVVNKCAKDSANCKCIK